MTDLSVSQNRKNLASRLTLFFFFCRYRSSDLAAPECIRLPRASLSSKRFAPVKHPTVRSVSTSCTSHKCDATPITGWIQGIGKGPGGSHISGNLTVPVSQTFQPWHWQAPSSTTNPLRLASASATFLSSLHSEQWLALLSLVESRLRVRQTLNAKSVKRIN